MPGKQIASIAWYRDPTDRAPAMVHSFIGALATSLQARGEPVDMVHLMGASAWAFRILVHEALCPSATSVFDWVSILPHTVHQVGYEVRHHFAYTEQERRALRPQALAEIRAALDAGTLPVAWDVQEPPEWSVITGYDDDAGLLHTQWENQPATLPYDRLGEREIPIISVTIPGARRPLPEDEVVAEALRTAVRHARQGEWLQRPVYQDGLPAYAQWAHAMTERADDANWEMAWYYGATWYAARWYAVRWLERVAPGRAPLGEALAAYTKVRDHLEVVWEGLRTGEHPTTEAASALAQELRAARAAEQRGIAAMAHYLGEA